MTDANVLDETDQLPAGLGGTQSLAVGIIRAEIDQQIATARAFPRSIKQVTDRIFSLATLDKESAEESMYALPRGGKPITGPSIRFAEVVKQSYGNCRAAARVVHVDRDEKFVEAEGVFQDLETNVATTARVRRRIVDSKGRLYSDDMIIVTGNAACSIALRNAIMGGVPKPLWRRAYEAVQMTIKGDITTLVENRANAIKAFAVYGVKPEQIFAALGVAGIEDITVEHIPVLRGMFGTLKNGEATVEEMFASPLQAQSPPQPLSAEFSHKTTEEAKASVESKRAARKAATPKPPPAASEAAPEAEEAQEQPEAPETQTAAQDAAAALGEDDLPEGLRAVEVEATEPDAVPEEGPDEIADEVEESEADDEALPPEMQTFVEAVESVATFVEVKHAMATFFKTDTFKAMPLEQQNFVRCQTWETLTDREAAGDFTDLPDHAIDVSAFRLWLEAQDDSDAISGTLSVLERQPGFAQKDDAFKAGIRAAVNNRIGTVKG